MMRRSDDSTRLLQRARRHLEPATGDAERLRRQIAERLSGESGVHRNEVALERAPVRSGPGLGQLVVVGVVSGMAGLWLGLSLDRRDVFQHLEWMRAMAGTQEARAVDAEQRALTVPSAPTPSPTLTPRSSPSPSDGALGPPPVPSSAPPAVSSPAPVAAASARPRVARARDGARHRQPMAAPPAAARAPTVEPELGAPPYSVPLDLRTALALLRRAEQQRRAGEPEAALGLLRELEQQAPALLVEERLLAAVLSECDLGHIERARDLARAVAQNNASSIYTHRLRSSCVATPHDLR
jgi:hypothetical protein